VSDGDVTVGLVAITDLGLVAYLQLKGRLLLDVQYNEGERRTEFLFEDVPALHEARRKWLSSEERRYFMHLKAVQDERHTAERLAREGK